jgi:hypothetical protein
MDLKRFRAHYIGWPRVIASGVMTVFYLNQLIALVNEKGQIVWRDTTYPLFLVEYLIENPPPQYRWN